MEALSQDVRQSIRGLSRTPVFTAIAVGTIALGIAAVTSMFTVASLERVERQFRVSAALRPLSASPSLIFNFSLVMKRRCSASV